MISRRQLFFFLACVAPVGKMILLPARLAEFAANDLLFPALIQLVLQAGAVFCVLLLAKRKEGFCAMLEGTFGKVLGKILCCIFALFLLFAALIPLLEQKLFVQSVFYDTLPSIAAFAPFFVFSAYLCSKPLSSFGRMWDILAVVFLGGFLGIVLLSAGSADFGALLPVGSSGGKGIFFSTVKTWHWFFDAALLLPLLGKIEYKRHLAWQGALCYLFGGVAVLFFLALFYGVFQETAANQLFAFSLVAKYFPGVTTLGRVDYAFSFALSLVMAFYVLMPLQGAIECALQAFGREKHLPTLLSVGVNAAFFVLVLALDYKFGYVLEGISGGAVWLFPLFALAVPVSSLLLRRARER